MTLTLFSIGGVLCYLCTLVAWLVQCQAWCSQTDLHHRVDANSDCIERIRLSHNSLHDWVDCIRLAHDGLVTDVYDAVRDLEKLVDQNTKDITNSKVVSSYSQGLQDLKKDFET